ncbi:LOW QUALITY PROTEIN: superkiller complex protein 2 [Chamaea fasciata]|uniref:LOW QUALITY PROTEIN: superkiller complex protein 2 n=1 Tax=Chamaea fasciata TaxID=190680 RepID=UPI00336A303D
MELERLAIPPRGPRDLPLALLELGCSGRFELLTGAPGAAEAPEPRQTLPLGPPPFAPPPPGAAGAAVPGDPRGAPHPRAPPGRQALAEDPPSPGLSLPWSPPRWPGSCAPSGDPQSGALVGFAEELLPTAGLSPSNSSSLRRPPGNPADSLRGGLSSAPFWPGGQDEPTLEQLRTPGGEEEEDVDFETELLTTPPGMKRGVEFKPQPCRGGPLSLSSLLETLDSFDLGGGRAPPSPPGAPQSPGDPRSPPKAGSPPPRRWDSLEELLGKFPPRSSRRRGLPPRPPPEPPEEVWAELVDAATPVEGFEELLPEPAHTWSFRPDPFQQRAVLCLERGHSVLVAAHTSAGKTAVAEYAIALARRHMTRSVYTSPIKALSNQKFRDFRETFGDVGLLTGDVQLRPEAACLVMTTEILRSMLYNGSDVIRDLEWVIFDEVHYVNDDERGVVWEEVLILLPEHVKLVLLSATVPNALEFAQWVGRTKRRCVKVLSTPRRPVPLEHFLFTGNSSRTRHQLFQLLGPGGAFSTQGYYAAVEAKKEQSSKHAQSFGARQPHAGGHNPGQERGVWLSLLETLRERELLPAVTFTFSRGRCEDQAAALGSLDLLAGPERGQVRQFLARCLARLRGSDRRLPQVLQLSELLQRGIGVHHGGVLPLLKEVVEMLFSQGLVKVLFATETFAMGVNMPARTVVFDSIRKHDGNGFRDLLPGEYTQMSGRAGRRGLDATGTVIILCKGPVPELADLHRMMLGRPSPLQSRFRLTYPMILLLLRAPALRPHDLMRRSFAEFPLRRDATAQTRRVAALQEALSALGDPQGTSGDPGGGHGDLPQYHRAVVGLRRARAVLQRCLAQAGAQRVLAPGRVVVVCTARHRNALGLLLQVTPGGCGRTFTALVLSEKPPEAGAAPPEPPQDVPYPEDLLLTRLFLPEGPPGHCLEQLRPEDIVGVTGKTLRVNPEILLQELRPPRGPRPRSPGPGGALAAAVQELFRLAGAAGGPGGPGLPLLEALGVPPGRDPQALAAAAEIRELGGTLRGFRCVHSPRFPQQYSQFAARQELLQQLEELQFQLSDQSLLLLPEYHQRLEVLSELGYVSGGAVALGGRVAALLSTEQLVLTELLLGNVLAPLRPEESVALLSCLVTPGRGEPPPEGLPPALAEGLERLRAVAARVGLLEQRHGLGPGPDDFVAQFGFSLVQVVYEWARGMPFAEIARLSPVQEGSVVRAIQRLEELLRELRGAARVVGDPALASKMEAAAAMIKRDIVFAASLYTQ